MNLVFTFVLSALVVVAAGTVLARNGDVIAAHTRLGGLWVGSVFLAVATSLPELTTDISAVRLGVPDLAAGDLFGSSMANMLILAVVSLASGNEPLFRKVTLDHALYATLAIVLGCIAAVSILFRSSFTILGMGAGSILVAVVYVVASRAIFRFSALPRVAGAVAEMGGNEAAAEEPPRTGRSLRRAALEFVGASIVILLSAPVFARSAAGLAESTGLGSTFFGTWLVGLATSLPELVTSLAAVRLHAYDLAVGNLFGSNAVNMVMFVPLDLAHSSAPIMSVVSTTHAVSALIAVLLMATALAALVYRAKGRFNLLEPTSIIVILAYGAGLLLIYFHSMRL